MSELEVVEGEVEVDLPVATPAPKSTALVARDEIGIKELVGQSEIIQEAMRYAMQDGVHYGRIPGVDKPSLLKPGAEKLCVLFRLSPSYESEKIWHDDGHLTVMSKCILHHIPTSLKIAEGEALCTTKETRYAFRSGGRVCPECGQSSIIKGKAEYGGGWICFRKKGGCGAKWDDGSPEANEFENASTERMPNPDLADSYNTVLKMADKRALLAAILNGTAASDVFTQDMAEESAPRAPAGQPRASDNAEPWSPDTALLPSAPAAKRGWKGISEVLQGLDPAIDWQPIIRQAISHVYGGDGDFRTLPEVAKQGAARRAANAAGRLTELNDGAEFVTDENILKAFAEMFEGVAVQL